jgi:hypothetical protein
MSLNSSKNMLGCSMSQNRYRSTTIFRDGVAPWVDNVFTRLDIELVSTEYRRENPSRSYETFSCHCFRAECLIAPTNQPRQAWNSKHTIWVVVEPESAEYPGVGGTEIQGDNTKRAWEMGDVAGQAVALEVEVDERRADGARDLMTQGSRNRRALCPPPLGVA